MSIYNYLREAILGTALTIGALSGYGCAPKENVVNHQENQFAGTAASAPTIPIMSPLATRQTDITKSTKRAVPPAKPVSPLKTAVDEASNISYLPIGNLSRDRAAYNSLFKGFEQGYSDQELRNTPALEVINYEGTPNVLVRSNEKTKKLTPILIFQTDSVGLTGMLDPLSVTWDLATDKSSIAYKQRSALNSRKNKTGFPIDYSGKMFIVAYVTKSTTEANEAERLYTFIYDPTTNSNRLHGLLFDGNKDPSDNHEAYLEIKRFGAVDRNKDFGLEAIVLLDKYEPPKIVPPTPEIPKNVPAATRPTASP